MTGGGGAARRRRHTKTEMTQKNGVLRDTGSSPQQHHSEHFLFLPLPLLVTPDEDPLLTS